MHMVRYKSMRIPHFFVDKIHDHLISSDAPSASLGGHDRLEWHQTVASHHVHNLPLATVSHHHPVPSVGYKERPVI
jgi:hypothetical protein